MVRGLINPKIADMLAGMARDSMSMAYVPYSGYTVGAALLTVDGDVITGCNIENAAYSPTCCAERVAIFKAVSSGHKDFVAIAVAGGKGGVVSDAAPPCGVCRQVMQEFCDPDSFVIIVVKPDGYDEYFLKELLPEGFGRGNLDN